jgi:hypothetical protein
MANIICFPIQQNTPAITKRLRRPPAAIREKSTVNQDHLQCLCQRDR